MSYAASPGRSDRAGVERRPPVVKRVERLAGRPEKEGQPNVFHGLPSCDNQRDTPSHPIFISAIKSAGCTIYLVEAAGIEPASESESFETTTCVVDLLCCRLVHTGSDRQDPDRTSPEGFAGGAGTGAADYPAAMSPRPAAQAPPVPTGYLIAQAANAYELSLAFEEFPRISEVVGDLGTRSRILHPRRSQVAPTKSGSSVHCGECTRHPFPVNPGVPHTFSR